MRLGCGFFLSLGVLVFTNTTQADESSNDQLFIHDKVFHEIEKRTVGTDFCTSIPESTRYFLYRRFAVYALDDNETVQEKLKDRFEQLAYLACRESSGRVVAHVSHEHEKEAAAARYGSTYEDMIDAINRLVQRREDKGNHTYFDATTNAGMFQTSPDTVSKRDTYMRLWFSNKLNAVSKFSAIELKTYCGTEEHYDEELTNEIKNSMAWMVRYVRSRDSELQELLFTNNQIGELAHFHELQAICPGLNLDLANELLVKYGRDYFGPLRGYSAKSAQSCGKAYHICRPTFNMITNYLNQYSEQKAALSENE